MENNNNLPLEDEQVEAVSGGAFADAPEESIEETNAAAPTRTKTGADGMDGVVLITTSSRRRGN